jgi:hypothetical protein
VKYESFCGHEYPVFQNVSLIIGGSRDHLRRLESGLLGTAISRHRYTHIGAVCGPVSADATTLNNKIQQLA